LAECFCGFPQFLISTFK